MLLCVGTGQLNPQRPAPVFAKVRSFKPVCSWSVRSKRFRFLGAWLPCGDTSWFPGFGNQLKYVHARMITYVNGVPPKLKVFLWQIICSCGDAPFMLITSYTHGCPLIVNKVCPCICWQPCHASSSIQTHFNDKCAILFSQKCRSQLQSPQPTASLQWNSLIWKPTKDRKWAVRL